jgi:hypothetical protein
MKYLDDGVDVLVTNVHKLQRMIKSKKVLLSHIEFMINDESDVFVENMKKDYENLLNTFTQL